MSRTPTPQNTSKPLCLKHLIDFISVVKQVLRVFCNTLRMGLQTVPFYARRALFFLFVSHHKGAALHALYLLKSIQNRSTRPTFVSYMLVYLKNLVFGKNRFILMVLYSVRQPSALPFCGCHKKKTIKLHEAQRRMQRLLKGL